MLSSVDMYAGIAINYKDKLRIFKLVWTSEDLGGIMIEMLLTLSWNNHSYWTCITKKMTLQRISYNTPLCFLVRSYMFTCPILHHGVILTMSLSQVTSERRQIAIAKPTHFLLFIILSSEYFYPSFDYTNDLQYQSSLPHPVHPFFRYLLYNSRYRLMTVVWISFRKLVYTFYNATPLHLSPHQLLWRCPSKSSPRRPLHSKIS